MTAPAFDNDLLSQIEDAGLNASAPPQQLWMDGWLLRLSPGKAKRARCVNAVAAGRLPLADKLARAAAAFHDAGLPMVVRITPFSQPAGFDQALAARGLHRFDDTRVLAADLATMDLHPTLPDDIRFEPVSGADYAAIVGGLRNSPQVQRQAHAERLAASPVPYRGWVLRRRGDVLACGQTAREGFFVGLYDVFTAPSARNQGLSRALCAELLRQAAAAGARTAYLQVDSDNTAALAVYSRLGFGPGYDYHYRAVDPALA